MKRKLILCFSCFLGLSSYAQSDQVDMPLGMRIATLRYAEVGMPQGNFLPVWQSDKCGFLSLEGEVILPPTYDKDKSNVKYPADYQFRNGFMKVLKNGKYGFINSEAKEVISCKYDDARDFSEGRAAVKIDGLWGFIDEQGKVVVEAGYKEVYSYSSGMAAVVNEQDSVGFIDQFGLLTIPFYYDKVENIAFVDTLCSVRKLGTEFTINKVGEKEDVTLPKKREAAVRQYSSSKLNVTEMYEQAPVIFDELKPFQNGFAVVMQKNQAGGKMYGILSSKGEMIVPCEYDQIEGPYSSVVQYFIVERNGALGAIRTDGSSFLPCEYEKVFPNGTQLIMVQKNGLKGFVDKKGAVVVPCQYENAAEFNASVTGVAVQKKDKTVWNFINQKGEVVATPEYEEILPFCNGVCPVKKKGKWGFVDEQMKPFSSFKYDYSFSDVREKWSYQWSKSDLIPISKEGKFGYINKVGKEVIPCQFEDALAFTNSGLARVQKGGKYGFINEKGVVVIPCQYEKATSFRKDFAVVTKSGVKYTLDKNGVERRNENVTEETEVLCQIQVVEKNGLYGIKSDDGKMLTACVFDQIETFEAGYAPVKIVNRWGVIDCTGKIVVPCLYDDVKYNGEGLFSVKVAGKRGVINAKGQSLLKGDTKMVKWMSLKEKNISVAPSQEK